MTTVFVSPHFDDVALSCVAQVLAARREGRVAVVTAFGSGQPEREAEDTEACRLLDVEARVLPFLDAPTRLGLVPSVSSLLIDRHEHEATDCRALRTALLDLRKEFQFTRLFLPLGVGGHVDHRIAHDVHTAFDVELCFYEDRPYANVAGAVRSRLLSIGAASAADRMAPCPGLSAIRESILDVFGPILPPENEGEAIALHYAQHLLSAELAPTTLHLVPTELPRPAIVGEAIACYRSQLSGLFGDTRGLNRFLVATPIERVWRRAPCR